MKKIIASAVLFSLLVQPAALSYAQLPPGHDPLPPFEEPTPTVSATPTPSPSPSPVDTTEARNRGRIDGNRDGAREGGEVGFRVGEEDGHRAGFAEGFQRCEADERQRAHDGGFLEGTRVGEREGDDDGERRGRIDGDREGTEAGIQDGRSRADARAKLDATPPGRAKGIEQANATNAPEQGEIDGTRAGDRDALSYAIRVDYARGKADVNAEKYAEAVSSNDSFSQKPGSPAITPKLGGKDVLGGLKLAHDRFDLNASRCRKIYWNPRKDWPTQEENDAYLRSYENTYDLSCNRHFEEMHRLGHSEAYPKGLDAGCYEARRRDYRPEYNRGYSEGHRRAYDEAYQQAYRQAHKPAFDSAFRTSTEQTYRAEYQKFYDQHFEAARASAYTTRYNERYYATYRPAYDRKYNEVYPGYRDAQYARGRADESADFANRPIRLLEAKITETVKNGLFEPGEALRVKLKIRNFSGTAVSGKNIKLRIQDIWGGGSTIPEGEAVLVKDINPRSVTEISDALEVRLTEQQVQNIQRFRITVLHQGTEAGNLEESITAKFAVKAELAELPKLAEGLVRPIKIRLTNVSEAPTESFVRVNLATDQKELEIVDPTQDHGALAAGESRTIVFKAVAHTPDNMLYLQSILSVSNPHDSRRIGVMGVYHNAPVANDYRIVAKSELKPLLNAGITRVQYEIKNMSSRLNNKALQLRISVTGADADKFAVLGPNPQYLSPVANGKLKSFVVPIMAKAANGGGTIELEVLEDGVPVVTHRAEIK